MQSTYSSLASRLLLGQWLVLPILTLGLMALVSTPLLMARLVEVRNELLVILASLALSIFGAAVILRNDRSVINLTKKLVGKLESVPLLVIVSVGMVLRILWVVLFPAEPGSDGAIYLLLAERFQQGASYEVANTRAYWPPGYPFFLSGFLQVLGDSKTAYLLSNMFVFLVGISGVHSLGRSIGGEQAGKIGAMLFAIWPNLVFNSATPEKEMLVLALLPWVVSLLIRSFESSGGSWRSLSAGLLLGMAILVQPSLQFLPLLGAIVLIILTSRKYSGFARPFLFILGAIVVIAPWTWRNYEVFDRFVLVSTNGGDNFYRANNPLATGGYTLRGEADLSSLDEIERDKQGRRLAIDWIKQNPLDFAKLAIEKQFRFMGDDAVGVYTTLKVGKASDDSRIYTTLKLGANLWWIAAWGVLIALILVVSKRTIQLPSLALLPIWFWLYLYTLHAVFESAGKYHVPALWVPCVMIGVIATALAKSKST